MRRIWVAVLTTWALIAIVGLLAWTHRPGTASTQATQAVTVQGAGGSTHVVLVPSTAVHGTTQTSPAAAGATPIALATGAAAAPAAAVGAGG